MTKLTLVTGNKGKVAEFSRILQMDLSSVKLALPEVQAVDVSLVAQAKAKAAYDQLGSPVIVDDTGLTIKEWGRLPGALIAWFLDEVGNAGILKMLKGWDNRSATVTTAIGYCDEHGPRVFTGTVEGSIAIEERGENGFGYDPIFLPTDAAKTFAEMSDGEKDEVSMRRLALSEFKAWLEK